MRSTIIAAALIAALAGALPAVTVMAAEPKAPTIEIRIKDQQAKINHGVKTGKLTKAEAETLEGNLNRIREQEEKLKKDGKLTPAERTRLNQMLNQNAKMIFKEKHDQIKRID